MDAALRAFIVFSLGFSRATVEKVQAVARGRVKEHGPEDRGLRPHAPLPSAPRPGLHPIGVPGLLRPYGEIHRGLGGGAGESPGLRARVPRVRHPVQVGGQ
jgi:hypothetical protein